MLNWILPEIVQNYYRIVGPSLWNGLPSDLRSLPGTFPVLYINSSRLFSLAEPGLGAPLSSYLEGALYNLMYRYIDRYMVRMGIQVLYSCVLWPNPARVTCLHHRWGAIEAEIFVLKFLPWPGFEPRTSQSNGCECYHSTTTYPRQCRLLQICS